MGLGVELVSGDFGTLSMDEWRFSRAVSKASVLSSKPERASLYRSMQALSEFSNAVTVVLSMKSKRCFCEVSGGWRADSMGVSRKMARVDLRAAKEVSRSCSSC